MQEIREFDKANKLSFILDSSKRALVTCKQLFYNQFKDHQKKEEEWCKHNRAEVQMRAEKEREVMNLLEQCKDYYWVEALNYFIFQENVIPTLKELEEKANGVRAMNRLFIPGRQRTYAYRGQTKF